MDVDVIDVGEGNMGQHGVEDDGDDEYEMGELNTAGISMAQDEEVDAEPYMGMEFESEDAAKTFYDEYARRVGFSTRLGQSNRSKSDRTVTTREFICARDGLKRRAGDTCDALLRIESKGEDKWVVTKFVKEHTHSTTSPSKVHYLRPRRHFAGAAKHVPETYPGVGMVPSGVMHVSMDGNRVPVEIHRGARNAPHVESNPRHCISKWHVLREGQERLAHVCHAHPNFQVELYNCINLTETVEEFESSWNSILDKYDLKRNDWLQSLYNSRKQWVQVYFRDAFFATISPIHEFESSFFDGYVNHQTTLPLFFRQYERALENSLEKEIEADFDTICTTPVLRTPSPMEKQAANLYTRKIFSKFQEELVETFVYTANRIDGDGAISTYPIRYAEEGAIAPETYTAAMAALKEGGKRVAAVKKNIAKVAPPSSQVSVVGYDDWRSASAPDMTPSLWPRQDEVMKRFNLNDAGIPAQSITDLNLPRMAPVSLHRDDGNIDNMVILPCLKSMTWVMENKNSAPANRVAVINLKLQDYSRIPSGESEVKFQLSTLTLEPMLRSMAYISEQLSTPANRVAVINLKDKAVRKHLTVLPSQLQDTETTSGESEVKFQVSRDTLGAMLRSMAYIREQLSNA
ncbi:hypothetical protein RJ640_023626, partial [Escallonia rubra]